MRCFWNNFQYCYWMGLVWVGGGGSNLKKAGVGNIGGLQKIGSRNILLTNEKKSKTQKLLCERYFFLRQKNVILETVIKNVILETVV